jgi:predicted extracellular nuclease
MTQSLDHILLSPVLFDSLTLVQVLHLNADFPIWNLNDATAQHVSDHDPLVAIINLE